MTTKIGDISAVSFSHQNTTLEQRDTLALSSHDIMEWLPALRKALDAEVAILSTCNRTEFYTYGVAAEPLWPRLKPLLCERVGFKPKRCPQPDIYHSTQAAHHLCRVAASLESLALGENRILAQVKTAHDLLLKQPGKSPVLDRLMQYAVRAGKLIRTQTKLCDGAVSISSASVDLAKRVFGSFESQRVVLVGAGETAVSAGLHFKGSGARDFVVLNRSEERGRQTAALFEGTYAPLEDLVEVLHDADIVVFATGSKSHLLNRAMLKGMMRKRQYRQLLLIDISNPRNVASDVTKEDGLFLYNIDHLKKVVEANLAGRESEIPAASQIIAKILCDWGDWMQSRRVEPAITSLNRHFAQVRDQELLRHQNRIDESQKILLEEFSNRLIRKLLHNPIMYLKHAVNNALSAEDLNLVLSLYDLHDDSND